MTTLGTSMMGSAITTTPILANSRMMTCLPAMPIFGIESRRTPAQLSIARRFALCHLLLFLIKEQHGVIRSMSPMCCGLMALW